MYARWHLQQNQYKWKSQDISSSSAGKKNLTKKYFWHNYITRRCSCVIAWWWLCAALTAAWNDGLAGSIDRVSPWHPLPFPDRLQAPWGSLGIWSRLDCLFANLWGGNTGILGGGEASEGWSLGKGETSVGYNTIKSISQSGHFRQVNCCLEISCNSWGSPARWWWWWSHACGGTFRTLGTKRPLQYLHWPMMRWHKWGIPVVCFLPYCFAVYFVLGPA